MTDEFQMSIVPQKSSQNVWAVNLNDEWLETDKCVFIMKVLARVA